MVSAALVLEEADALLLLDISWMLQVPANPKITRSTVHRVRYRAAREAWCSLPAFLDLSGIPVTGNFIHGKEHEMSVRLATNTRWRD